MPKPKDQKRAEALARLIERSNDLDAGPVRIVAAVTPDMLAKRPKAPLTVAPTRVVYTSNSKGA